MKMELQILDWIQQMRTPVGDVWMVFISRLGNAGMIWILFTCLLLMIPMWQPDQEALCGWLFWLESI